MRVPAILQINIQASKNSMAHCWLGNFVFQCPVFLTTKAKQRKGFDTRGESRLETAVVPTGFPACYDIVLP